LHELKFPATSLSPGMHQLVAFGGKGYGWAKKKKKKHKHRDDVMFAEQDDMEDEDDDHDAEEEEDDESHNSGDVEPHGRRLKRKKWRKEVQMLGDTWAFDPESRLWEEVQLPWGAAGNSPVARWKPSSTVIQNHTGIALFGGCKSTNVAGVMNDFWVFRPGAASPAEGAWKSVQSTNTPQARRGHVAASLGRRFVVYGGKGYNPETGFAHCLTDTWILENPNWDGEAAANVWRRGADFPSGCRWGGTGTPLKGPDGSEYLAVFGGRNLNPNFTEHTVASGAYIYYNELWLYDPIADIWNLQRPEGPLPHPRDHHGASMVHGDLYVFGGRISEKRKADAVRNDLWSYSLWTGRWVEHHSIAGAVPSARYMPGVSSVHYNGKDAVAVFAGENLPGSTKRTTLNDVWVYEPDVSTWTLLSESDCSRVKLSDLATPSPGVPAPTSGVASFVTYLACLGIAALVLGLSWKVVMTRCRPAAARVSLSTEAESTSNYECMG